MAVKIRLNRAGGKKKPYYKVVVADSRMPRDGRHIEVIGAYDPTRDPSYIEIDLEKADQWIKNGAQASNQVSNLMKITRSKGAAS